MLPALVARAETYASADNRRNEFGREGVPEGIEMLEHTTAVVAAHRDPRQDHC